jgi:hypothetical protein
MRWSVTRPHDCYCCAFLSYGFTVLWEGSGSSALGQCLDADSAAKPRIASSTPLGYALRIASSTPLNAVEKLPKSGLLAQSPTVLVEANDNDKFHVALRLFAEDDKGPLDLKDFSFVWKKDGGSVAWYQ